MLLSDLSSLIEINLIKTGTPAILPVISHHNQLQSITFSLLTELTYRRLQSILLIKNRHFWFLSCIFRKRFSKNAEKSMMMNNSCVQFELKVSRKNFGFVEKLVFEENLLDNNFTYFFSHICTLRFLLLKPLFLLCFFFLKTITKKL